MKLYQSNFSPNSRRVRIFLAEKGIEAPRAEVDISKGQSHTPEYLKINPMGAVPALVLDDGTAIAESVAICRYFETLQPGPTLFGTIPKEIVMIEMWQRRTELKWFVPLTEYWLHTSPIWAHSVKQIGELAEQNRAQIGQFLTWLDSDLRPSSSAGREFIAGDRYSIADIIALTTMDHANSDPVGLKVSPKLRNLARWHETVSSRPSARA
jgi:glutathione S-transferase